MRDGTIDVRIKPEERAIIRAAADRQGLTMSAWVRMVALRAAAEAAMDAKERMSC
jgi:uncharacterized protein (DUF1778 family)